MSSPQLQRVYRFLWLILFSALVASCSEKTPEEKIIENNSVEIVAVNNPLFFFSKYLAGDLATVSLPVPAGVDPARWQPLVNDILKLQQADLIVLNGAGYSNWLDKVSLPSTKLLDSSATFQSQLIKLDKEATHSHGPKGEYSHSGYAFTTWMDMTLAKQQASAIANALVRQWPEQQQKIRKRKAELLEKLANLDKQYQIQASRLATRTIIYSHPVYQYFQHRYQLPGHSMHWEPHEMPSEEEWHTLKNLSKGKKKVLFVWEDVPDLPIANRMSAMDIEFVVIRPAANRSEPGWLDEQESNLERLKTCCN